MKLEEYQLFVKEKRAGYFLSPYELAYEVFKSKGFSEKDPEFFLHNASLIVEELRKGCWDLYTPIEKQFTSEMLCQLIDEDEISNKTPRDAVIWFAENFPDHIYQLSLSNTQSRRSRAGKEFEAIIELILIGAGIPMDSQGNIGKRAFVTKGLGKLVDVVSPGVVEYIIDKNDTILISAKTTLRERWQEVPEEMGRTGAKEMFLATLDENISDEVLETLYESNIRITTTKAIKEKYYPDNKRVLDFEKLIALCLHNDNQWADYTYSEDDRLSKISSIGLQIDKHKNHDFILQYYYDLLSRLDTQNG